MAYSDGMTGRSERCACAARPDFACKPGRANLGRALGRLVLAAATLCACLPARAESPLRVTTTLSVLRALARAVGGDRAQVEAIVAPQFDPHFVEPRPSDILRLARSQFLAHMGLDLELWRGPLVEAAVNPRLLPGGSGEIDCSAGIKLLEVPARGVTRAEGDIHLYGNPHYWLDPANASLMASHIAGRLSEAYPQDAALFSRNLEALQAELERRAEEWRGVLAPFKGARLASYHNSWPYFAEAFGLRIDLFLEPKPGIPPSGAHLEWVVAQMKRDGVRALIVEPFQPRRTAESVAERAGAQVVELWQNPRQEEGYVEVMDRNVRALAEALREKGEGGA